MTRLKQKGMTFSQACTVANACSASRASLLTGTYPSLNGVVNTLSPVDEVASTDPGGLPLVLNELRPTDPNLARILTAAGYKRPVWKGKWHLSEPRKGGDRWTVEDIDYLRDAYGFHGWNPRDAGTSLSDVKTLGGGTGGNDERYVTGKRRPADDSPPAESALDFIKQQSSENPFFMVVSLTNPHDIWVAPVFSKDTGYGAGEIDTLTSEYGLPIPETADDPLRLKPAIQSYWREFEAAVDVETLGQASLPQGEPGYTGSTLAGLGEQGQILATAEEARQRYVNFYAYLQTLTDKHIEQILHALDDKGLTEDTLIIRLSDHGEMGLAHGLREKEFVAYDEAIQIPLIFSNPKVWPEPVVNDSPVCNIDIAPTLARLAGVYDEFAHYLQGFDLTPILEGSKHRVQDFIHYLTDDSSAPNEVPDPGFIRAIRSPDWMYAVDYIVMPAADSDSNPTITCQYELYDLKADPDQETNLAGDGTKRSQAKQRELHELLIQTMQRNATVPRGVLLPTAGLSVLTEGGNDPVPNPVWPTAEEAIQDSILYRQDRINQG